MYMLPCIDYYNANKHVIMSVYTFFCSCRNGLFLLDFEIYMRMFCFLMQGQFRGLVIAATLYELSRFEAIQFCIIYSRIHALVLQISYGWYYPSSLQSLRAVVISGAGYYPGNRRSQFYGSPFKRFYVSHLRLNEHFCRVFKKTA